MRGAVIHQRLNPDQTGLPPTCAFLSRGNTAAIVRVSRVCPLVQKVVLRRLSPTRLYIVHINFPVSVDALITLVKTNTPKA